MSFRDFTLDRCQADFGIAIDSSASLFPDVRPVGISPGLAQFWLHVLPLGLNTPTEKGRSEFLVAPLLAEVWLLSDRAVSVVSGLELNFDVAAGLNGVCDFALCHSRNLLKLVAPVLLVVEAKRESILGGLGQCAAEMIAARRFNIREGSPAEPMFGCVTTGSQWKFLRLTGSALEIDTDEYSVALPDQILGVLLRCAGVESVALGRR